MFKVWALFFVAFAFWHTSANAECQPRGKIGGLKVPDVMSLNKDQNGFSATIEIITPEEETFMVTENYNGAKLLGSVEVNWVEEGRKTKSFYYSTTKEKFIIEDDICDSTPLDTESKYEVINTWIAPGQTQYIDLFGSLDILGPTTLLTYARSVSDKAGYNSTEQIDGRSTDHWLHCLGDGEVLLEWWFDSKTKMPVRFTLESVQEDTGPHIYNFLIFNPITASANDLVSYPMGFGCLRPNQGQPAFPTFITTDSFSLDAEAIIMYNNPDKVILSSLRMMKYQSSYSLEISDEPNTTRIIQNPSHMGRYVVKADTGECDSEDLGFADLETDGLAVTWPYHIDAGFNLLESIAIRAGVWSNYMGQVSTDSGTMDVWEDDLYSFFSKGSTVDASVTYFFPAIDRTKKPHQAPTKILIRPQNRDQISMRHPIPYQIEIIIIDYTESNFELSDRFDVSGCFDGPGEFTWFQIVMSDSSSDAYSKDMTSIRSYFEETLATFIPVIRIPEIVVSLEEFNFYVSVKLLERPPFKFHYSSEVGYTIDNPTTIVIRDALEDCGDICSDDLNCKDFSYCSDYTCRIFSSASSYSVMVEDGNCTFYSKRYSDDSKESIAQRNILTSTRSILKQVKSKINNGEIVIPKYALSAEDMFIVSGPEEIGGIEEEFDENDNAYLRGDEFAVIATDSRIARGTPIYSVSYADCLKICQNDDDCYSISYCSGLRKECVTSNYVKREIAQNSSLTSKADGCNVLEKSFLAFYRKFPGQSIVKDAISRARDLDESECARQCYETTGFTCKSFDYCEEGNQKSGSKAPSKICFFHQFHAVEDTGHEIVDQVWDFSSSSCDHYAVRLSRDYKHYVGRSFKDGAVKVTAQLNDLSLERCAADCNSDDCVSFEYCEYTDSIRGSSNLAISCRLSSSVASPSTLEVNSHQCSVYQNPQRAARAVQAQGTDHFGLAMGLGSCFFIAAFALGVAGSVYYQRKSS